MKNHYQKTILILFERMLFYISNTDEFLDKQFQYTVGNPEKESTINRHARGSFDKWIN
jgi:hypothetical protein